MATASSRSRQACRSGRLGIRVLRGISLLLLASSGCDPGTARAPSSYAPPAVGTVAPDFTAPRLEGGTFRLADHRGQVVLLDFWATTCEPCRAELPRLQALMERNAARHLVVIGVNVDGPDARDDVAAFVRRFAIAFPVVLDADADVARLYDPSGAIPLGVVIDRQGRVASLHEGYEDDDAARIDADVEHALTSAPAP